jgi:hypothetical protein
MSIAYIKQEQVCSFVNFEKQKPPLLIVKMSHTFILAAETGGSSSSSANLVAEHRSQSHDAPPAIC